MMYQTEIAQQQPTQFGLIKEKVHQIPKMIEQHIQKRFPVAPVMEGKQQQQEQEPMSWEKRIEREQVMRQIKDLVGQVQTMLVGHEEQYGKTEQQELLRQIREIQSQIQGFNLVQPQQQEQQRQYGWEKKVEKDQETIRKISELQGKIQDMIYGEQKKQQQQQQEKVFLPREHKTTCQYETTPVESFGECQSIKCEQQWGRQVFGEKRRQLIEKLIQQTRVLEEMLVEQQYETFYQMPKMEQLQFHLERELFEQIKKRFADLEEQFFGVYGYEQPEVDQKQRKLFVLLKKQIKQIEDIIYPIGCGIEIRMQMKTKEQIHREQCQQLLEKVRGLKTLFHEIVYLTCPETCEEKHQQQQPIESTTTTTYPVESLTKFYNLINLPLFFDEEEIFGRPTMRQQETENIVSLRKQLEEIKMAKQDLEMKLYETDKKAEQFKRQIELLEKFPKYEQQQQQQVRAELIQYTKPEEELIKICLKPTQQQQPTTYTTGEPKTEMLIKSRVGKFVEQQQHQQKQQQQPITKYF